MEFDPALSLRLINNERLRRSPEWAEYRDLGGALAVTSDSPGSWMNCLESFHTTPRALEGLLDIGFALLRAFDREPAVVLTPLDRPRAVPEALRRRGMSVTQASTTMVLRPGAPAIDVPAGVAVRVATADDVTEYVSIVATGGERWSRKLARTAMLAAMSDGGNTFYLAAVDGTPVGAAHLLGDGVTAGIYALTTLRAWRGRGVATALIAAALGDAASCDVVGARVDAASPGERLFARLGFERAHTAHLWTFPDQLRT